MKIFANKISKVIDKVSGMARYIKTEPYPADSVHFTQYGRKKVSFWAKLKNFFGFEPEINPQTFIIRTSYARQRNTAWKEVVLSNGKKLLVDTQNNKIIDVCRCKVNAATNTYLDCDMCTIY